MPPPRVKPATPVGLRLVIDVGPDGSRADRRPVGDGIDAHAAHLRDVDHDAAVAGREAGDAVAAAAHGDRQVVAAGEADRGDHVGWAGAPHDECGPAAVVGTVPDPARLLVAVLAGGEDLAADGFPQLLDRCFPEDGDDGVAHDAVPFLVLTSSRSVSGAP